MQPVDHPSYPNTQFAPPQPTLFSMAETVATVGDQHIFRGDLIGDANLIMAPYLEQMTPQQIASRRRAIETQREQLVERLLQSEIDRKLMYLEFLRNVPQDKLEEIQENVQERIGEVVKKQLLEMLDKVRTAKPKDHQDLARQDNHLYRLAVTMVQQNMTSVRQLDLYLRRYGSSLDRQTQTFKERALGQERMRDSVNFRPEVTHQEMLGYYRDHLQEFEVAAKASWQQLTVRFDRLPDKVEARNRINAMGNELLLGGKQFWAVAQQQSHGTKAKNGGFHDWIEYGDLGVSREINDAVFTLPIDHLSRVIQDGEGFHIVKVLERHDRYVIPFLEAQLDIKKKIESKKRSVALAEYLEQLRERTPVWTIYDERRSQQRMAEPPRDQSYGYPR